MNQQYVIGIDIGGTNTVVGIVDAKGAILCRSQIDTTAYATGEDYAHALGNAIHSLIDRHHLQGSIKGIGLGAPNGNMHEGTIRHAANISWSKDATVPITALLTRETGLPCRLTNDANAAALGEQAYGVAKGLKDFIVITLGTGLGSGIVAGGQLLVGHDGFAGELGHIRVVRQNGRACNCGRSGCLETYASATGVARTAREMLELQPDRPSRLRDITHCPLTSKDVFLAAEQGDDMARDIFCFTARILGEALADFIAFTSPRAIILFGGLAHAHKYLLPPLREAMDHQLLYVYRGKTDLLISQLNDDEAAILGASALAWE